MKLTEYLSSTTAPGPRKRRAPGEGRSTSSMALRPVDAAIEDAQRRSSTGEWGDARAATFVGLYALCHRLVYGVVPDELGQRGTFSQATRAATRLLHDFFDDDPVDLALFVRWAWDREKRRDAWARQKGVDRNRLSFRVQFSPALVTDWRVDAKGRSARRGG